MAITCIVRGCDNKQKAYSPVMFHRIPTRHKRRKVWLAALNMDPATPVAILKNCRVCSEHFTEEDYTSSGLRIKNTATPTFLKSRSQLRGSSPNATATYEESCTGITFDVSEFTFDEDCSNEQGGEAEKENNRWKEDGEEEEEEEEKEIDDSGSDWEMENSDHLESNESDQSSSHDSDQMESDNSDKMDSELRKSVRQLCPECGAFFYSRKPHTCEYKIKPVSCNICGKRCKDERSLKVHSYIHQESYEHPCKFCMAPFETRLDKLAHESTHTRKAKPYECPDCPMTFSKLPARNLHLKGHRGPKIFSCPHCALQFPSANHLKRHIVVHTDLKEFVCEFCSRSFNQPGHLKSHLRVHTGEKPYQCQHCDKSFNHNVSLKSHLMRYHGQASSSGPREPMKPNKQRCRPSMGRPRGRPQKNAASEETNSNLAVQMEVPDPITAADTSEKDHLREASSKDIESECSYKNTTSELAEGDKGEETKGVRMSKQEAGQRPMSYCIGEKDFESDLHSNPAEEANMSQVVKSQATGRRRGRPRKSTVV